ncbi:Rhodocoxin reductase [Variovorax sp. PBS-H4]|uniref:NAD(P)/FAD-dependent oxidoreductase n=1 Tax=Variovorax sp. PBS-H4 TaxID=434008 RepID=UPI001318084D|nr:FAD-dependent oxidoreductase [Variovorax sp. PBS-H4]VTU23305.1 Rhodocoxin reductase [Variovorax sp. PBS-H4]
MSATTPTASRAARAIGQRVVIVGGGQAAGAALRRLRQLDYPGPVALVSDEAHVPYERPPLSKEYLSGTERELRWVAPGHRPNERIATERTAVAGDVRTRTISCNDGTALEYDFLLIATGGMPRRLGMPGADLDNVHCLRHASDAIALKESIRRCSRMALRLLVVGGSWIGLEVAAAARGAGVEVTVVEQAEQLCRRTLPCAPAALLHALHAAHGVDLRLRTSVAGLDGGREVRRARLSDGSVLSVGAVVGGIGITPNTSLAQRLGLLVRSGIVVDRHCRSSVPEIYAAGDVAEQACHWHDDSLRIETWENANRQGETAAMHMAALATGTGEPEAPGRAAPPWFWSDQYDMNLQVVGAPVRGDAVLACQSSARERLFVHLRGDLVVGAVGMNKPREMRRLRKLLTERPQLPRSELLQEGFGFD